MIFLASSIGLSDEDKGHLYVDKGLTFSQLLSNTVEKIPERLIIKAFEQDAAALQRRGKSWLAAAPSIAVRYQDDWVADDIGFREAEVAFELPLWNWGQRSAGQSMAQWAHVLTDKHVATVSLYVAGLLRNALWELALADRRYEHVKMVLNEYENLLATIKRRVDLGDLPRSDLLLVESEYLQKKSAFQPIKADRVIKRSAYSRLTQSNAIPANYKEALSDLTKVTENHPKRLAVNVLIERKKSEIRWLKSAGSGQSRIRLAGKSETSERAGDDIESMSIELSIPFGGEAHLAPEVSAANLVLIETVVQKERLVRQLNQHFYQAKQALETSQEQLKIADELRPLMASHLKMSQVAFSAGSIRLIELLNIHARSHKVSGQAGEYALMLQKNIALYNQAVGVMP